jgi:PD-(D/E)XK nuclease superfamily protein
MPASAPLEAGGYADLVCAYLLASFADRGISVYREVSVGKSIIGKNRRIDVFVLDSRQNLALALECKFQSAAGTTDEKIPYALQDLAAMRMPSCLVYGGDGWSDGVRHMLRSSSLAAYCLPDPMALRRGRETVEIDHVLAQTFRWWDILLASRPAFELDGWRARQPSEPP